MIKNTQIALLALDSYNRGYNESVYTSQSVGNYSFLIESDSRPTSEAVAIGFYAAAYKNGNEIVISYRGTDGLFGGDGFGNDLWNGYGVGAGSPHGNQAKLAIEFYKDVLDKNPGASISFTGHSAGGGLAGLVAGIYKKPAMLYDNMAFEGAVENAYKYANRSNAEVIASLGTPNPTPIEISDALASRDALKTLIYGASTPTPGFEFPTSSIKAFHTEGDFLAFNRVFQDTISAVMEHGHDVNLSGVLDSGGWHSMATLAMLTYIHGSGLPNDWMHSAKYFWPVLYDAEFANKIGVDTTTVPGGDSGTGKYDSALRQMIAYSAIDEGVPVFGNTAIRAFYNDANDLGKALSSSSASLYLESNGEAISKVFVDFAGQLAIKKITGLNSTFTAGVVKFSTDQKNIIVSLEDAVWKPITGSVPEIASRTDIYESVLKSENLLGFRYAAKQMWGTTPADFVDQYIFAINGAGVSTAITSTSSVKAKMFVATNSADVITGSSGHDIILGKDGTDNLSGGNGDDILDGGTGNDILSGGEGNDILMGVIRLYQWKRPNLLFACL